MGKKIPFKAALESIMGREFLSAITPFGSGGQPLGIYILNQYGLKVGQAITVAYLETFYTILILFLTGVVSLFFYSHVLQSGVLVGFLIWSFGAMIYFFLFSYFSISKPRILKKMGFYLANLLSKVRIIKPHNLTSAKVRILKEIQIFNEHIRGAIKSHWFLTFNIFFFTLLFWIMRFLAVYPIVLVLGYKITLVELVAYQMIITSVNYFSFTPGSSGTTDWLGAALFGLFIPPQDVPTFITIWRFFSYHLIVFICGIVVFKVIKLFTTSREIKSKSS
jgi:uncharacterized protein (TIRG00374 family)